MSERVLTRRELNRALLARQLLLRRERLPVTGAIERIGALQAQWPPAPFLALWARLEGFERAQLERAVARRRVVKATLHRATLHLVTAADYAGYAGVFSRARIETLLRRAEREGWDVDVGGVVARLAEATRERPRTRPELVELLGLPKLTVDDAATYVRWHLLAATAELVHGPESSAWRRNTAGGTFAPAEAWLGTRGGHDVAALVRRHLAAFGPATRADTAQWTGQTVGSLADAIDSLPLRRFRDEAGRELLDLPRAPLPPPDTPAPVRFLPTWDSSLLAHADRTRILPEEYRSTVIRKNGDVQQTFLVDGFVAGLWRHEGRRVRLEPFAPLPRAARRALDEEARALAAFHA